MTQATLASYGLGIVALIIILTSVWVFLTKPLVDLSKALSVFLMAITSSATLLTLWGVEAGLLLTVILSNLLLIASASHVSAEI
ncbi:hypothetical protein A9Q99_20890 [Gammaproteobacteria bacterium 45_16_T64]|nr:hypothetical protein A9Q99_20890 [Gammaproteobacteria bacterium 45_16_T64]